MSSHAGPPGTKKAAEKAPNHERWVISYADFMTLLLATFVVLYAVSSINVSRYREAAEAFSNVFNGKVIVEHRGKGAQPNGIFEHNPAPIKLPMARPLTPPPPNAPKVPDKVRERVAKLNQAYANLTHLLHDVIATGQVHIAHNGLSVVIDINASVLFQSGSADLTTSALGVIDQIGWVLKDLPYAIQVNGYTDDAPIHTAEFDSNWELSAVRAMSVVRRFVSDGVNPAQLVGAGYGQYHPIASNDTPEGMAKNRRVSIVVVSADNDEPAGGTGPQAATSAGVPSTQPVAPAGAPSVVAPPVPTPASIAPQRRPPSPDNVR
jgi:chemotaxis protein MotB